MVEPGEIERELRSLVREVSWGGGGPLSMKDRLREDAGLDSVALIDLIVGLEGRFGITVDPLDPSAVRAFRTFGSLLRWVGKKAGR